MDTNVPLNTKLYMQDITGYAKVSRKIKNVSLCPLCRGTKLLCGKPKCPVLLEYEVYINEVLPKLKMEVDGNSPPSVFVGRIGYPKVWIGPLVPPVHGDTSIYGIPEKWVNLSIDEILRLSSMLIYGRKRLSINAPRLEEKYYLDVLDIAISRVSPEVEMYFDNKPTKQIILTDEITPFGPTANLRKMIIGTLKIDYRIEKCVSDYDLKAEDAVYYLYKIGIPISAIQRVFSIGGLGIKRERKLVPTRWSITAIDDIIGKKLIKKIKQNPTITEILTFKHSILGNKFIILMIPGNWSYEFLEAWFPGTFWNKYTTQPIIYNDHETYKGRTEYPEIGGCYHSARLAVAEFLFRVGRQALVVVFREVYSDYLFPVGVWVVREAVREALRRRPERFTSLSDALQYVFSNLRIPASRWFNASALLSFLVKQVKLTRYLSKY